MPVQTSSATFNPPPSGSSGNLLGSQTQTLTREREEVNSSFQKELDDTIYELREPPSPPSKKNGLGHRLLNLLGVEHKFVNKKEQEDAALEAINEEYNFDEITDAFDESAVPH